MSQLGRIAGPIRRRGLLAEQDTDANSFAMFFTTEATATEYDLAGGGRITATHDFNVQPTLTTAAIRCLVSEHGFSVSEEIPLNNSVDEGGGGTKRGGCVSTTATGISFQYENQSLVITDTAGNKAVITATNWRVVMRCWA